MIRILEECQSEDKPTKFQTGDIITHIRYGYRGVIVHTDPKFKGAQIWYLSNQTQPQKEQSWFFVLVTGSQQVTYVAEENLNHYHPRNTVVHPMLTLFFSGYVAELNRYIFAMMCNGTRVRHPMLPHLFRHPIFNHPVLHLYNILPL